MKCGIAILVVLAISACGGEKTARANRRNTEALALILPILEAEKVSALRYQDWCKAITYHGGSYFETNESGNQPIKPAAANARPFDPAASADLERIWNKIVSTAAKIYMISDVAFNEQGQIIAATFHWKGGANRHYYVYSPGYDLPEDLPNERWHHRINADWYYILEDWN